MQKALCNYKIKNAHIIDPSTQKDEMGSLIIKDGCIEAIGENAKNYPTDETYQEIDAQGLIAAPGLVDMRVFVGEPGAEYRETLASASMAAASGGVTTMITMPDTHPIIDDGALVDFMMRRARDTANVKVHCMAALTKDLNGQNITEIGLLQEAGAVAFTNGRKAISNSATMRNALTYTKDFQALIVHHVEDEYLKGNGVTHSGENATRFGLASIPSEAETIMLDRDLQLANLTKGYYHAAQLSCAKSVEIMKSYKEKMDHISCGVSINHLSLNENDIGNWRSFCKMSPPLRTEEDRQALIDGVSDGTIDVIVSAHDPQDVEMKRHPFAESADGSCGLETLLSAGLRLVHDGRLSMSKLIHAMSTKPAKLLGLEAGTLKEGTDADLILFDPDEPWIVERKKLKSRSKNTAFDKARFSGRVQKTFVKGALVFDIEQERLS